MSRPPDARGGQDWLWEPCWLLASISCTPLRAPVWDTRPPEPWGGSIDGVPGGIFLRADFRFANFIGESFREADLRKANLSCADMVRADLRGADLREAELRSTNLRDAELNGADLTGAVLTGADLERARMPAGFGP